MGFSLSDSAQPRGGGGGEAFGLAVCDFGGMCGNIYIGQAWTPPQSQVSQPGQRASEGVKSNGLDSHSHIWMHLKLLIDGPKHKCAKGGYISRWEAIVIPPLFITTIRSWSTSTDKHLLRVLVYWISRRADVTLWPCVPQLSSFYVECRCPW